MQWTPYLDECLGLLNETNDFPTDKLLVYLARVQLIHNAMGNAGCSDYSALGLQDGLPQDLQAEILQSRLEDLKRSIPPDLKANGMYSPISMVFDSLQLRQQPYSSISSTWKSRFTSIALELPPLQKTSLSILPLNCNA
jgi:hypothetical protein